MNFIKRINPYLLKNSLFILLIMIIITTFLAITISSKFETNLINSRIRFYPQIIKTTIQNDPDFILFFKNHTIDIKNPITTFLSIENIINVKIWNKKGIIIYNNFKNDTSHKNLVKNKDLTKALKGEIAYSRDKPEIINKNHSKNDSKTFIIYIPIMNKSNVIGVLGLVESDEDFIKYVEDNTIVICWMIALSGFIIYILLFSMFLSSFQDQHKSRIQLSKTLDVIILGLGYQAELRDSDTGKHIERTSKYVSIIATELKEHAKED
jgi:HD-GYP domain-containing protein (c-di-GMP phosphodiesterase class II)